MKFSNFFEQEQKDLNQLTPNLSIFNPNFFTKLLGWVRDRGKTYPGSRFGSRGKKITGSATLSQILFLPFVPAVTFFVEITMLEAWNVKYRTEIISYKTQLCYTCKVSINLNVILFDLRRRRLPLHLRVRLQE
jgi:hypothetical protein